MKIEDPQIWSQPLATRMRPRDLTEIIGQSHLLAPGKSLRVAVERKTLHSMILWGPPGTGKTTLAQLLANRVNARVEKLSAVCAGVKDIREVVNRAQQATLLSQATILFVDEIHRFNKAQQDAFLPLIEEGVLTLIGATTENPSFELNGALLSRARVYLLRRLTSAEILQILQLAMDDNERGLGSCGITLSTKLLEQLAEIADGDARQALNCLEICVDFATAHNISLLTENALPELFTDRALRFDKNGEHFYDQISALHKSVRGSAPDAALYWFCRMIDGGCDPSYLSRRIIRIASEDVGNADPRALSITLDAAQVYERLGSPEGELALAQAVIYLAVAPKSNAAYLAFNQAMEDVKRYGSLEVPLKIRNAPTKLMKNLGYGKSYRYAHDEEQGYAAGEDYLPPELPKRNYYQPVPRGQEIKIGEKLQYLRQLDQNARQPNPSTNDD